MKKSRRIRVLSLEGGGVRGIVLAQFLETLNTRKGIDVCKEKYHFDIVVGTSTGGLLAAWMLHGVRPRYFAETIKNDAKKIFPKLVFILKSFSVFGTSLS